MNGALRSEGAGRHISRVFTVEMGVWAVVRRSAHIAPVVTIWFPARFTDVWTDVTTRQIASMRTPVDPTVFLGLDGEGGVPDSMYKAHIAKGRKAAPECRHGFHATNALSRSSATAVFTAASLNGLHATASGGSGAGRGAALNEQRDAATMCSSPSGAFARNM